MRQEVDKLNFCGQKAWLSVALTLGELIVKLIEKEHCYTGK